MLIHTHTHIRHDCVCIYITVYYTRTHIHTFINIQLYSYHIDTIKYMCVCMNVIDTQTQTYIQSIITTHIYIHNQLNNMYRVKSQQIEHELNIYAIENQIMIKLTTTDERNLEIEIAEKDQ